ncbi:sugar ABC transporter ATP-binding protein [Conexibacter sp. CPCC 206217]|uniref:sugar ABC transporter ATP-binding protein n=1 Tax=Conexibacter sp. CPCC 206217 TaxID=3064574 RepID=UPI00271F31C4|nr:sugar ABC transporter ATP-binding protein [Conexibacter sp. CPCC 206217]MDO8212044.1 sugar ABC transporter ATP-binding protein [Conexibacter sp. CPCC 206217]
MSEQFAAEHVVHAYGANVVLHDVGFTLERGRVAALIGENGSGKSTLLKIMTGALTPTGGQLSIAGRSVVFANPGDAQRAGIAVVHQDYNLIDDLSIAENVYALGHPLPRRGPLRRVDRRRLHALVDGLLGELGITLAPGRLVRTLDAVERKFVEIARAMVVRPRFLILDEPTASLEPAAAARVLTLIEQLRDGGAGVALVSHRLDEVTRVSDEVTVLRDGRRLAAVATAATDRRELARLVGGAHAERARVARAGASPATAAPPPAGDTRPPALRLRDVRIAAAGAPIELDVRVGEVVGLTGLLGSGAARLLAMLGGATPLDGVAELGGAATRIRTPIEAQRAGIGFIAEDRKGAGLVPDQSVAENIALASLQRTSRGPWLRRRAIDEQARRFRDEFDIRLPSIHAPVRSLSGGNQQKVLLARALATGARVLVIDEPTHGVDVGGKAQIHTLLRDFAARGGAVLIASTDIDEILDLCDRVGVLRHGELVALRPVGELSRVDLTVLGAEAAA